MFNMSEDEIKDEAIKKDEDGVFDEIDNK